MMSDRIMILYKLILCHSVLDCHRRVHTIMTIIL